MEPLHCSHELRKLICSNFKKFNRAQLNAENNRRAAVAVTIVDYRCAGELSGLGFAEEESAAIILTRRSGCLKNHAGQWAFPGGSIDPGENPQETALRELAEEVGLRLSSDRVIGCLDDFVTRSGFHISPVVIWGGSVLQLSKNEQEVASIHRIPCSELFRSDTPFFEEGTTSDRPVLYMPIGDTWIATPTAAILYQFREVALSGRTTRVYNYDQPYFAWK